MRQKLCVEPLEAREVPAIVTAASIANHYADGWNPMPGVPLDKVGVLSAKLGSAPAGAVVDVYVALDGGAPRMIVHDTEMGLDLRDEFLFDPSLRGGISAATTIGDAIYFGVGDGGGPTVAAVDLRTFVTTYLFAPNVAADWRGGIDDLTATDIDAGPGFGPSPEPGGELLILCGDVVTYAEPDGTPVLNPVFIIDPKTDPVRASWSWEFAPASAGAQFYDGRMGFAVQPAGSKPDATNQVLETVSLHYDGSRAPADFPGFTPGPWNNFAPIVVG